MNFGANIDRTTIKTVIQCFMTRSIYESEINISIKKLHLMINSLGLSKATQSKLDPPSKVPQFLRDNL